MPGAKVASVFSRAQRLLESSSVKIGSAARHGGVNIRRFSFTSAED
jgi:hypothetical protein